LGVDAQPASVTAPVIAAARYKDALRGRRAFGIRVV
jgi:hypothetical protein